MELPWASGAVVSGRLAGPVGHDADHQHLVRRGNKDLPGDGGIAAAEADPRQAIREQKLPAITGTGFVTAELEPQIAERLVRAVGCGGGGEMFHTPRFGLGVPAGEDQAPDLGKVPREILRPCLDRLAGPKALLVDLDALPGDAAKDHCPEPAVANRQRLLFPTDRWFVIPKFGIRPSALGA